MAAFCAGPHWPRLPGTLHHKFKLSYFYRQAVTSVFGRQKERETHPDSIRLSSTLQGWKKNYSLLERTARLRHDAVRAKEASCLDQHPAIDFRWHPAIGLSQARRSRLAACLAALATTRWRRMAQIRRGWMRSMHSRMPCTHGAGMTWVAPYPSQHPQHQTMQQPPHAANTQPLRQQRHHSLHNLCRHRRHGHGHGHCIRLMCLPVHLLAGQQLQ